MRHDGALRANGRLLLGVSSAYAATTLGALLALDLETLAAFSGAAKLAAVGITSALVYSVLSAMLYDISPAVRRLYFLSQIAIVFCIVGNFAIIYAGAGVEDPSKMRDGFDYLYFSMVTFTTLGYGDIRPAPDFRLIAAWQAMFGFFYVPIVLSELVTHMRRD